MAKDSYLSHTLWDMADFFLNISSTAVFVVSLQVDGGFVSFEVKVQTKSVRCKNCGDNFDYILLCCSASHSDSLFHTKWASFHDMSSLNRLLQKQCSHKSDCLHYRFSPSCCLCCDHCLSCCTGKKIRKV